MKTTAGVCSAFFAFAFSLFARDAEEARFDAQLWAARGREFAGRRIGAVRDVRTETDPASGARMHVVRFESGGVAVVSAQDGDSPVVAFLPTAEDVKPDLGNPLWDLLRRDARVREDAARAGVAPKSPGSSTDGRAWISDVRVEPIVQSRWAQGSVYPPGEGRKDCYNYYTPKHYVCGCVATAASQIMRFHEWPQAAVTPATYSCGVDGVATNITMQGGVYDWANMPLDPGSGAVTEAQRSAIGKLTSDVGIAAEMQYTTDGSGAFTAIMADRFKSRFGYAGARGYAFGAYGYYDAGNNFITGEFFFSPETLKRIVVPNFDAGYPVMFSIDGDGGHAIVGDGYGYSDGEFYVHLNMGWSGYDDAWYCPPNLNTTDYAFNVLEDVVCDIIPENANPIGSGRVLDINGRPATNAVVTVKNASDEVVKNCVVGDNGIWFFKAPAGEYTVSAVGTDGMRASRSVTIADSVSTEYGDEGYFGYYEDMVYEYRIDSPTPVIGNSCDNDLRLVPADYVPPVIDTETLPSTMEMSSYNQTLQASGGMAPYAWQALTGWSVSREASTFSESGVAQGWTEDDECWELELPFQFSFAGKKYDSVTVCDNGVLTFDGYNVSYTPNDEEFLAHPMIAPLWADIVAAYNVNDIFVAAGEDEVTIRWDRFDYTYYQYIEGRYQFSVTLYADGAIRFAYGGENYANTIGGGVAVSAGDGVRSIMLSPGGQAMTGAQDYVLREFGMPPGLELSPDGTISGRPTLAGDYEVPFEVTDFLGGTTNKTILISVAANPNARPVIESATPSLAPGKALVRLPGSSVVFSVVASDPESAPLSYTWEVDGEPVQGATLSSWTWNVPDDESGRHTVRCIVSDGVWVDGVYAEWLVDVSCGTIYVDAATGDDSNGGLSPEDALESLQAAFEMAYDGDRIVVADGVYAPLHPQKEKKIVIESVNGPGATIIDGGGTTYCLQLGMADSTNAVMRGFTLRNGYDTQYGAGSYGGHMINCVFSNNVVESSVSRAVCFGGASYGGLLENCLFVSNKVVTTGYKSSAVGGAAAYAKLANCTFYGNSATGYIPPSGNAWDYSYAAGAYNGVIVNCVFSENTLPGGLDEQLVIEAEEGADYAEAYNFRSGDPKFVDAAHGDFRLAAGSPCIDAGREEYVAADATDDLGGNARVQGESVDVGAYEYANDLFAGLDESAVAPCESDGLLGVRSRDEWTVVCDADWITLEADSGEGGFAVEEVEFTVDENDGAERVAHFTITSGGENVVVALTQLAADGIDDPADGVKYHGLFVGINEYVADLKASALHGCARDSTNMLKRCVTDGFWKYADTAQLTETNATLTAIRAEIARLASVARPGDLVFYYHSSHGVNAAHGVSEGAKDAALMCYDGYYWDDDLADDLSAFANGVRVIVMTDACHSAGMFKTAGMSYGLDAGFAERMRKLVRAARARRAAADGRSYLVAEDDVAFMAAADYMQLSWDSEDGGDFTGAFLEGWESRDADSDEDGKINFAELFDYAADRAGGYQDCIGDETEAQCSNRKLLLKCVVASDEMPEYDATRFSPVPVPFAWFESFGMSGEAEECEEAAMTTAANGRLTLWESYLAGVDPTDEDDDLLLDISFDGETPVFEWNHTNELYRAYYRVEGKSELHDDAWAYPLDSTHRFFRLRIAVPY